ncbi:MAG TPA: hypothetical protein VK837_07565 [Longimicrobiales bacterium]|nr:hypothetical protein [Longimicrobiales bacterium]
MSRIADNLVLRGIVAGFVGASTLALWFLVIDGLQGRPFYTPAFLAAVITGEGQVTLTPAQIGLYTAVHYAAFLVVGIVAAWFVRMLEALPGVLLGGILGFLLFDLVFYGSVWLTGVDVVGQFGWAQVLVGNVLAGMAVMATLSLLGPEPAVSWRTVLKKHRILREGLYGGLIGAAAVAIWFLLIDAMFGRLLFTPGALGSVLFHGARSVADVQTDALTILGYSGLHLIAFFVTGLAAAAIVTEAEDYAMPLIFGAILLFVTFETFFIGMLAIVAQWLLSVIPWWSILIGNIIAAVAMGTYLWRHHPKLREAFLEGRELEEELASKGVGPTGR